MLDHIDPVFQQAIFRFEEDFDHRSWVPTMQKHWVDSIYFSAVYILVIFGLQHYMRDRPKLDLRRPLVVWSLGLAVFSTVCAVRLWQELFIYKNLFGWRATMCQEHIGYSGVNGFWSLLFVLSKLPELGDTLFIVLRKQKLIFLHWYHHTTVFVYAWYSYPLLVAPARYFILVNCSVHAVMYTYYTLRASRLVRIPRVVNICITTIQLSQMGVGCVVNSLAYYYRASGEHCSTTDHNLLASLVMYSSYFALFAHYFYKSYFARSSPGTDLASSRADLASSRADLASSRADLASSRESDNGVRSSNGTNGGIRNDTYTQGIKTD